MKNIWLILLLFIWMFFSSCLNRWEKAIVGYYEIQTNDTLQDIPTLTLKKDLTFVLAFKNKIKTGEWKANDNGDVTIVEFAMDGNNIQGQIGIDHISILNPYEFDCSFLREMEFKRIKKKK